MDNTNNYGEPITTEDLFKKLAAIVGSPSTVSLYLILVIISQMRYGEFFSSRRHLMRLSGISSTQTYHKAIHKLVEKKLLKYSPSFLPQAKSKFTLLP